MYGDPSRVRIHRVGINLNKYENDLIEAYANFTGMDKSSLIRKLAMREAVNLLAGHVEITDLIKKIEVT